MQPLVEKALRLAERAHAGQADKGGRPYIEHPIAVAKMLDDDLEKAVALLHDVIEDTSVTADDMRLEGFDASIIEAVEAMTKTEDEPYEAYLSRVKANPLALAVKVKDIQHNMDVSRLGRQPTAVDFERLAKYQNALDYLTT